MSGTLKQDIPAQKQELPGLQKEMRPEPFDTHLETSAGPRPYVGSGELSGKKALITGGDSGIGRAVAILFAREGADVSIINTTSVTTFRGSGSMPDYVATKGAIVGFPRSHAKDLVKMGIRVNVVAPGPVHTPLQPASRPPEQMEGFGSKTQIGRVGEPSEIAPSYVSLAGAESELYYGQILHPYPLGD